MPRGNKRSYTDKQIRKAHHIEDSYKERGLSTEEVLKRAWALSTKILAVGTNRSLVEEYPSQTYLHVAAVSSAMADRKR